MMRAWYPPGSAAVHMPVSHFDPDSYKCQTLDSGIRIEHSTETPGTLNLNPETLNPTYKGPLYNSSRLKGSLIGAARGSPQGAPVYP